MFFFFFLFALGVKARQCSLGSALGYLQVGDLEGAVFHQADAAAVSQDPLAVFLPLDARGGVPHDVAVQLSGRAGCQGLIGRPLADDGRDTVRRR